MKRRLAIMTGIALICAKVGFAQESRLQPDFTFKRVTAPTAGSSGNRITVQIAPTGPAAPSAPAVAGTSVSGSTGPVAGAVPQTSELDWFWQAIPPEASASVPGRLVLATEALSSAPEGQAVQEPSLAALAQIAQTYGRDILINTVGTDVSPALVLSVIAVESAGDARATSRVGAQGLMQLMPDTASRFGVTDSMNPSQNIQGGVAYLDWLMEEFDKDPILFLAAYNAGEGSIRDAGGVPNFPETRSYVPKVLAAWTVARALCVTPPELMSDGCVFSVNGD